MNILPMEIGYLIMQVAQLHQRETNAILKQLNITQMQLLILYGIKETQYKQGKVTQIDISRVLNLDKSMVSAVMKNLITKGYVMRQEDESDTRYKVLSLTSIADETIEKGRKLIEKIDKEIFDCDKSEIIKLRDLLTNILNNKKNE